MSCSLIKTQALDPHGNSTDHASFITVVGSHVLEKTTTPYHDRQFALPTPASQAAAVVGDAQRRSQQKRRGREGEKERAQIGGEVPTAVASPATARGARQMREPLRQGVCLSGRPKRAAREAAPTRPRPHRSSPGYPAAPAPTASSPPRERPVSRPRDTVGSLSPSRPSVSLVLPFCGPLRAQAPGRRGRLEGEAADLLHLGSNEVKDQQYKPWTWKGVPPMKYHQLKLFWWEHCLLAPTWFVVKITFLLLAFCFTAMLSLAFFSSDFVIIGHVLLLVTIGTVLFVLLNRFLAETGLVSVEQQMKEMGIHKTEATEKDKGN
uniref:Uncharacterized protein n=1 Tax=Leersia perrieri TaxID=77586 RepID=A0A0D9WXU5_9ORYZ